MPGRVQFALLPMETSASLTGIIKPQRRHVGTHSILTLYIISHTTEDMASFENKVVIITGCSSGIGLATTRLFLDRQANVFGIDITTFKEELSEAQKDAFTFHEVDLTIPKAAEDAVAACIIKHGPKIDVLVNCAGISDGFSSADTIQEDEWERVIAINLTVPVRLMGAVLSSMKEHKSGAIVNVASRAGLSGAVSGIAYTASKHGLVCPKKYSVISTLTRIVDRRHKERRMAISQ